MPPAKVSRVAKSSRVVKKPVTASAPRSKTSETASSKKKQKIRASAKKSKTPKPAETTIVIAGHKRSIVVVEEDSNDDGMIQPRKRRRTGGNTNAHDYHAVRERPPPRDYGATFARKSTAHFTWGAPLMAPPLSQSARSDSKNKSAIPHTKSKEVVRPGSWQARPNTGRYSGILSRTDTPESEPEPEPKSLGCPFLRIPLEIREDIYKYILVADEPIRVHQGWSAVYPRNRVGIRTDLIRTCRQVRKEALNTLYGENTFLYLLRDAAKLPALNAQGENEIVVQHPLATDDDALSDYEADSADEDSDGEDDVTNGPSSFLADGHTAADIDIRRFGHKFRKLMIVAEANRANAPYRLSMANAINVFRGLRPIRPRIHTLTIDITPQRDPRTGDVSFLDFFERSSEVVRTLRGLPCQFIEILVNTGVSVGSSSSGGDGDGSGGDGSDNPGKQRQGQEKIVLNMKYAANIRRAKRGEKDLWRDDRVMQSYRSAKAGEAQKKLDSLPAAIRKIWEASNGQFKRRQQDEFGDDEDDYCYEDWEDSLLFQDGAF
ncbi:hypothetical protein JMJ77_0004963 [Colletotrichum scovillei]|uniref:Uncharacterized protein n=1 Tax=Colletotrichum scovillei TaxID=1209932 RepID=A0A9P7UH29_9PEZI|nr:hypothetical protein JMJ77_0004963 [Colletotrichum scovillei]KAG7076174.1 hypothetical protein JMJ76_0013442 [Colletotrichum scovillei]KAG7083312.1 hypothetical protein JMJ78_0008759 [Colletotrichum scovillei]